MTILAKVCHVKLNKKVSIYMEGMWSTKILSNSCAFAYEWHCMTMSICIILILKLPPEYIGANGPVHVGKEDKQLKQHYYGTSSQKLYWWMFTIWQYYLQSVMSNWTGKCLSTWTDVVDQHILACLPMSDIVWQCALVSF